MLQPLQLEQVSVQFPRELEELRDFLRKSGIALDVPQSIAEVAGRLRSDRAFHRDLSSYVLALSFGRAEQPGYATLLALLALAAAGKTGAAEAQEQDAHDLLRFVMETQRSLSAERTPAVPAPASSEARWSSVSAVSVAKQTEVLSPWWRRGIVAAACLMVAVAGLWFFVRQKQPATGVPQQAAVPSHEPVPLAPVPSTLEPAVQEPRRGSIRTTVPKQRLNSQPSAPASSAASSSRSEAPTIATSAAPTRTAAAAKDVTAPTVSPRNAAAAPTGAQATRSSGVVPSAVLSRRLGSPTMPAYAADENTDNTAPRRPRLLRRSPSQSAMAADTGDDLVAELEVPANVAPPNVGSGTAAPRGIVRPGSLGMMAANIVYSPAPAYPPAASAAHVQGEVRVQATVDREGNVAAARVISGPPLLRDAALDAVQRWRYRPYTSGGRAIPTTALAVLDFELP